jgi:hypothetical protein
MKDKKFRKIYKDFNRTGNTGCFEMQRKWGKGTLEKFVKEVNKRDSDNGMNQDEYVRGMINILDRCKSQIISY